MVLRTGDNRKSLKLLEGVELLRSLVLSGDNIRIVVEDSQKAEEKIREKLKVHEVEVQELLSVRPSLEDAFVSIVRSKSSRPPFAKGE